MSFSSEQQIQPTRATGNEGRIPSHSRVNAVAAIAESTARHVGRNLPALPEEWVVVGHWIGEIVAAPVGQSEYTDQRYWVQRRVVDDTLASTAAVTTSADEYEESANRVVTVTNMPEAASGTHTLTVGDKIHVFDAALSTGVTAHYAFSQPVPEGMVVEKRWWRFTQDPGQSDPSNRYYLSNTDYRGRAINIVIAKHIAGNTTLANESEWTIIATDFAYLVWARAGDEYTGSSNVRSFEVSDGFIATTEWRLGMSSTGRLYIINTFWAESGYYDPYVDIEVSAAVFGSSKDAPDQTI